jgi:uncharacterized protein (TIGR02271 family)
MSEPAEERSPRPLEAEITPDGEGWRIRLPLRTETVQVEKRTVVFEELVVRRRTRAETARIRTEVQRERLRVDTFGPLEDVEIRRRRVDE